jgi:hypothetical protein
MDIVPYKYRPGTDAISKYLIKTEFVRNTIVKELRLAPQEYFTDDTEFADGSRCDALFASMTGPPIIVEIQNTMNEQFICRLVRYATSVYIKYERWPFCLTIVINEPSYHMVKKLVRSSHLENAWESTDKGWTEGAFFLLPSTIANADPRTMSPLASVALFLQEQSLHGRHLNDTTINQCYSICFEYLSKHNIPKTPGDEYTTASFFLSNYMDLKNHVVGNHAAEDLIDHGIMTAKNIIKSQFHGPQQQSTLPASAVTASEGTAVAAAVATASEKTAVATAVATASEGAAVATASEGTAVATASEGTAVATASEGTAVATAVATASEGTTPPIPRNPSTFFSAAEMAFLQTKKSRTWKEMYRLGKIFGYFERYTNYKSLSAAWNRHLHQ